MATEQFERAQHTVKTLRSALQRIIRGRDDTITLLLTGLFADGHVLIEDYPGSGKTTLAKSLGSLIDSSRGGTKQDDILSFRRIQFTPDLLPSDVLGVTVFDAASSTFRFQRGPIFSHIVLADEINRTGPKVQAAFLECMAERQVTIDNHTYPLDELFFVIGTQNPLEIAGTFPLPLVQLDRFLLKIPMRYVDAETELGILREAHLIEAAVRDVSPVVSREEVLATRQAVAAVTVRDEILQTIVAVVQESRKSSFIQSGASTRAAIMVRRAIEAWALLHDRDYATEDDLKAVLPYVLLHRLRFHPGAGKAEDVLAELATGPMEKLIGLR